MLIPNSIPSDVNKTLQARLAARINHRQKYALLLRKIKITRAKALCAAE